MLEVQVLAWCSVSHWSRQLPLQHGHCPDCLRAVPHHYTLEADGKWCHQPACLSLCVQISVPVRCKGIHLEKCIHMKFQEHLQKCRTAKSHVAVSYGALGFLQEIKIVNFEMKTCFSKVKWPSRLPKHSNIEIYIFLYEYTHIGYTHNDEPQVWSRDRTLHCTFSSCTWIFNHLS